jgi:hypothetical protein
MDTFIQLDSAFMDVFEQKIEYGIDFELFENFRKPSVQPGPGCKIGMASLG